MTAFGRLLFIKKMTQTFVLSGSKKEEDFVFNIRPISESKADKTSKTAFETTQ